jgi:diguanylate cyclase (GGDEF)-like protein
VTQLAAHSGVAISVGRSPDNPKESRLNKIKELISSKIRIPSPPAIAIRILDMIRKDDFTFKDLAVIIESDPALVARILKVANSSYYSFTRKVTSIETALTVLGSHAVKNIALSFVIISDLSSAEDEFFDFDIFWRRAITSAVAAELVSELIGSKSRDCFISALLQDIGVIIFQTSMPNDYRSVMKENLAGQEPLHKIEERYFGFNHHELGAHLLSSWHLPESIYYPILYQHGTNPIPEEYRRQKDILRLSDHLSSIYHGSQRVEMIRKVNKLLDSTFDIRGEDVKQLIDAVADKTISILASFDVSPGTMRPFSQILQDVNEELSNLNTSYELIVMELREAKEKAEILAGELQIANNKLHDLAFRDGLTGLYNHRYFQEEMERELERSKRYEREFSLIIFDIDHFKKINDAYGHPVGDQVLMEVSRTAEQAVRKADIVARYGGEEFAVILPETNFMAAKEVADRIRGDIERMSVALNGNIIKLTVSVGYTCYRHVSKIREKGPIISVADRALYTAKQSGRNMVFAMRLPGT